MKYVCSICGYVYDEAKEATPFGQLSDSWVCPLCGAPKSAFVPESTQPSAPTARKSVSIDPDAQRLSPGAMAALFSNLARGCEKQYKPKEQALFMEIADYFAAAAPEVTEADEKLIARIVETDLAQRYPDLTAAAVQAQDRGTQRICVWGEKVTRMVQSLLSRYEKEGEAFLEGNDIWVCTVCGFIYVGKSVPALCPVCKVPDWKFEKIEGRA